jgi:hypothetical protein
MCYSFNQRAKSKERAINETVLNADFELFGARRYGM